MSKNIFATITHVAEKITEAITGHKNDEQAHPNLSEQINVLSSDRGYKDTKQLPQKQNILSSELGNGKYKGYDAIESPVSGENYELEISGNIRYYARKTNFGGGGLGIYFNIYDEQQNRWNGWEKVATTSKTDILLTPKAGFTISKNRSYMISDIAYINILLVGDFIVGKNIVANIPFDIGDMTLPLNTYDSKGIANEPIKALVYGNQIEVFCTKPTTSIFIGGVIVK